MNIKPKPQNKIDVHVNNYMNIKHSHSQIIQLQFYMKYISLY